MMKYPLNWRTNWRPGITIPVFFLSFCTVTYCQLEVSHAQMISRGRVSVVGTEHNPGLENPAAIAHIPEAMFAVGHHVPFLLAETGISWCSVILPANPGSFRLNLQHQGIPGYHELSMRTGYGMHLAEKISAGIFFQYQNITAESDWNYLWCIRTGAGLLIRPDEVTQAGCMVILPVTKGNYYQFGPLLPSKISIGISREIYENTFMLAGISYTSSDLLRFKLGMEYQVQRKVVMACGYHSEPSTWTFGTGYFTGRMHIHVAVAWSANPGIHPAISFTYPNNR